MDLPCLNFLLQPFHLRHISFLLLRPPSPATLRASVAAKTEMSEQPLAHTIQTGLQELNNLGYSLAVTTNKHLYLDLSFTKLITL